MPKLGEINYLKTAGRDAVEHARNKPFSDDACGRYLGDLGLVMALLPPPTARVLDLGVGSGWTSLFLAKRGYDVVGRDICPDMIALAEQSREQMQIDSATFEVGDYETLPYRDEFDAVLFHDALHHAEDERAALAAAFAALKPGGVCMTVEPGEGHSCASEHVARAYGVTEKDMPPHHVIAIGRSVGFQEFRVFARSSGPALLATAGDAGLPQFPECWPRWRIALGFARKTIRALAIGAREGDHEFLQPSSAARDLRYGNIVWMRK